MNSKVIFCKDGVVMAGGISVGTWESVWTLTRRGQSQSFRFTPIDNAPDNGAGRTSKTRKHLAPAALETLKRLS